jgi:O-acetyl-ADP-ribose deacetylase (regulator of RNase III)
MINIIEGNLLDVDKGIIVHGCNARGVMGSGIALQIKQRYPLAYKEYLNAHTISGSVLGTVSYVFLGKLVVVNAVTQESYGRENYRYVSYDAVAKCFEMINNLALKLYTPVVNFPLIGAGLGGGDWNIIESIIDSTLDDRIEKNLWIMPTMH